jgi:hypothetical protein
MTCSNADFNTAAKLALKNKWEEASVIWQKYTSSSQKRNRIITTFNLALAKEIKGDIDGALQLIAEAAQLSSGAFRSSENESVKKYATILERRKNEIKKLDQQHDPR